MEKAHEVTHEVTEKVAKTTAPLLPGAAQEAAQEEVVGDPEKGKTLFVKCASCHGPKGERHALGKSAVIAGMDKDELIKILKEYKEGTLNKYGMGALMKGQVADLSDKDIADLAAYISSLK
ncbi:MAG: c-type cytochrome [Epsilonproteobacteria bacterium]|nr:c-type cytochrome [Campylobacterota bacterium]